MSPDASTEVRKVSEVRASFDRHDTSAGYYVTGVVRTPQGFVQVYSEDRLSRYDVIVGGLCYSKREEFGRSHRGLAIVAARFAREVAGT